MNSFVVTEFPLLKQFEVKAFAFYVLQCFEHSVLTYINVMKNLYRTLHYQKSEVLSRIVHNNL
jgi:hypothetical protein